MTGYEIKAWDYAHHNLGTSMLRVDSGDISYWPEFTTDEAAAAHLRKLAEAGTPVGTFRNHGTPCGAVVDWRPV